MTDPTTPLIQSSRSSFAAKRFVSVAYRLFLSIARPFHRRLATMWFIAVGALFPFTPKVLTRHLSLFVLLSLSSPMVWNIAAAVVAASLLLSVVWLPVASSARKAPHNGGSAEVAVELNFTTNPPISGLSWLTATAFATDEDPQTHTFQMMAFDANLPSYPAQLFTYSGSTGTLLASTVIASSTNSVSNLVSDAASVYLAYANSALTAVNVIKLSRVDLSVRWNVTLTLPFDVVPGLNLALGTVDGSGNDEASMAAMRTILYVQLGLASNYSCRAMDAMTGNTIWLFSPDELVLVTPFVAFDHNYASFGWALGFTSRIWHVDARTGKLLGNTSLPGSLLAVRGGRSRRALGHPEMTAVTNVASETGYSYVVSRISAHNGTVLWQTANVSQSAGSSSNVTATIVNSQLLQKDVLFIVTNGCDVVSLLQVSDGTQVWQFTVSSSTVPALTLYCKQGSGNLVQTVDGETGKVYVWGTQMSTDQQQVQQVLVVLNPAVDGVSPIWISTQDAKRSTLFANSAALDVVVLRVQGGDFSLSLSSSSSEYHRGSAPSSMRLLTAFGNQALASVYGAAFDIPRSAVSFPIVVSRCRGFECAADDCHNVGLHLGCDRLSDAASVARSCRVSAISGKVELVEKLYTTVPNCAPSGSPSFTTKLEMGVCRPHEQSNTSEVLLRCDAS